MVTKSISVDTDVNLIQTIRIIHALCESEFEINLPSTERQKLSFLIHKFNLTFNEYRDDALKFSQLVKVEHFSDNPNSIIGNLQRPLIFPHQIAKLCKSIWNVKRDNKFTFTGLFTGSRKKLLEEWMIRNIKNTKINLSTDRSFLSKAKKKIFGFLNLDNTSIMRIDDLIIWSSTRGRQFPLKSWDENYYSIMANSEFVLCPSGDFVWTYRFFEAILCGAIPIVEETCEAYSGFKFKRMNEDAKEFKWRIEDAEHNYNLCINRITIPLVELNSELNRLWREMAEKQTA